MAAKELSSRKLVQIKKMSRTQSIFDAVRLFCESLPLQGYQPNSCVTFSGAAKQFAELVYDYGQNVSLKMLDKHLIKQIHTFGVQTRGWDKGTAHQRHFQYRIFFDFCVESELLFSNPMNGMASPTKVIPLPSPLSEKEIERLLRAPDTTRPIGIRSRTLYEVMYACGLRVTEASSLRVQNLILDDPNNLHVRLVGKGGRLTQTVPMHAECARWLKIQMAVVGAKNPKDFVFPRKSNPKKFLERCNVRDQFAKDLKKSKIRNHYTPHKLRHSFATHLLDHGTPVPVIKDLTRHKSFDPLKHYLKVSKNLLIEGYKGHPRWKVIQRSPTVNHAL